MDVELAPLLDMDGHPFDWNRARADLHALVERHQRKRHTKNQAITPRLQAILAEPMPESCMAMGEAGPYVPAVLVKEAASLVFRDQWNTRIVDTRILADGPISVEQQRSTSEARRTHLVAQCTIQVSVVSTDGTQHQQHEAIGLAGFDQRSNDAQYMKKYRIACKGAETAALRNALERFGLLFTAQEDSSDLPRATSDAPVAATVKDAPVGRPKAKPLARRAQAAPATPTTIDTPKELSLYANGTLHHTYPNTPDGAYQWIAEREELGKITNTITNLERNETDNAAILAYIEQQYGKALAERIQDMKASLEERTAILSGIGRVPPAKQAKRQEKPLENAEIHSQHAAQTANTTTQTPDDIEDTQGSLF